MDDGGRFKKGDSYSAADVHALWWVQATLTESSIAYWHLASPEKTSDEFIETYWRLQGRRLFLVMGLLPETIPLTYKEFEEEYVRMWLDLGVTEQARAVVRGLQSSGRNKNPLTRYMMWSTFEKSMAWLPPPVREGFGPFPCWIRIYAQLGLYVDLGIMVLIRSILLMCGAGRMLEMSYFVEMQRRAGVHMSRPAKLLHAVGRAAALAILRSSLGGGPAGLQPDWT